MKACDRCMAAKATAVAVVIKKYDGSNRLGRSMITADMELCEVCITDLLIQFGRFKVNFIAEGDTTDAT